jgi:hypothetical protein
MAYDITTLNDVIVIVEAKRQQFVEGAAQFKKSRNFLLGEHYSIIAEVLGVVVGRIKLMRENPVPVRHYDDPHA